MTSDYRESYANKTVLVTGGAGAIGSTLSRALAECGAAKVVILDNLSASYEWSIPNLPNVLFVKGDITNDIDLKRVFHERPSHIFHLAAFFANQNSVDFPERDLLVSQLGTVKLLEHAIAQGGIKRFVYAGSGCAIYGAQAPLPLKEDFVSMHLTTPYQISKMAGELYVNFYWHHYGLPVVKTRFFNSYGPGEVPGQYRNVIPNFMFWAMRGQPLPITGSGKMTRDFTYVTDIVDALLRSGYYESAIGQEMNIASGREIEIIEMAEMVNKVTGNTAGLVFTDRRKWDTKSRLLASIDRAREVLGYAPTMSFESGIGNLHEWFKEHWDEIQRDAEFPPGMSAAVKNYVLSHGNR
ncbi:MAG TPA: NAD-dependent epimerase/dehydratase family protein [Rhizomicrobium sp.]